MVRYFYAIIKEIEILYIFLLGRSFILRGDHKAIQYHLSSTKKFKLVRRALKSQEYRIKPEYIKEKNKSDGLSRQKISKFCA